MFFGQRKKKSTAKPQAFRDALIETITKNFSGSKIRFASYMGVKIRTVDYWLNERTKPRLQKYHKFKALGISWKTIYDNDVGGGRRQNED